MAELRPLGRHVEHDVRSRRFAMPVADATALRTVLHQRHVPIFDQGTIGSCTGNAAAGCMATGPWPHKTTETDATTLYREATRLDRVPGHYPPDDTGSSGLAVMKAVKMRGWITGYRHCFSLNAVLAALQTTPVIAGFRWYEGFDEPGPHGLLTIAGSVRGGHETCLQGADMDARTVRGANSWGDAWGDGGYYSMSFDTLDELLHQQGDVTVPGID